MISLKETSHSKEEKEAEVARFSVEADRVEIKEADRVETRFQDRRIKVEQSLSKATEEEMCAPTTLKDDLETNR
jgi:hypothetical protein